MWNNYFTNHNLIFSTNSSARYDARNHLDQPCATYYQLTQLKDRGSYFYKNSLIINYSQSLLTCKSQIECTKWKVANMPQILFL